MIKILFNLITQYKLYFFFLVFIILFEGLVNMASILSLIPFTEFILNNDLSKPSKITGKVISIYENLNINISYWTLGFIFVLFNFIKVINIVFIRYTVSRCLDLTTVPEAKLTLALRPTTSLMSLKAPWNLVEGLSIKTMSSRDTTWPLDIFFVSATILRGSKTKFLSSTNYYKN